MDNSSSRRSFLGKIAAGAAGVTVSTLIGKKVIAAANAGAALPEQERLIFAEKKEKKFVPVMITPYDAGGKIDFNGVSRLIDFYLAAGVKGFFANCLSSEMYSLNEEERLALARHVVKYVNGAVPVVATGSFGQTIEDRAEFAKKMYHTGVNAVILVTSHYANKEDSDDVLFRNFEKMCTLTDNIPMGLYECPSPYKRIITPTLFKSLLDTNRLIYHKDTSLDIEKVKAKLALIGNNRLEFYDAHTPNTMFSLQMGARGMSAIAGNFYPEILVWMCNNATDPNKQEEVKWLQSEITKADEVVSTHYPMSSKYFLQKRGLPILTSSRLSATELTPQEKQAIDQLHQTFLGWCRRLNIQPVQTPKA
jgi:4-hydroxy-tetrahydrodipicolinate synthase